MIAAHDDQDACGICFEERDRAHDHVTARLDCGHYFCHDCWDGYLTSKIQDGQVNSIICPGYQCVSLVPPDKVEGLVSPAMARRFLQFDIRGFVEHNPLIRWCPSPGCTLAVKVSNKDLDIGSWLIFRFRFMVDSLRMSG